MRPLALSSVLIAALTAALVTVDETIAEAERRGWTEVRIRRLDSLDPYFQQASLGPRIRIVLDARDEAVVRVVVG